MVNNLEDMNIEEISLVDKGANPGAKAVLVKRDFTQEQRDAMASKGTAMPDGSYPIANVSDLKNAIQAFGRAKNKEAVKRHIISRARSLGASDTLPEEWKVKKNNEEAKELLERLGDIMGAEHAYGEDEDPADADNEGLDFDTAYAAIEAREYAADVLDEVQEASEALYRSIHSILDDETITDPEKAVKTTIEQFKAHMANLVPEEMEKALSKLAKAIVAGNAGKSETVNKGVIHMADDVNKALADKDAEIAKLNEILKGMYSADEADYMAKASDADKEKFKGMSAEERKAAMEKECGKMTKREELPEDVRKALDENESLKKRLDAIEAEREFEGFKKRAADVGLGEDFAKHLHVIAKASPEAAEAVEKLAKAAHAVEKASPLFKEVGSSATTDNGTAQAELVAKAQEIAKAESVSFAKAYVKAAEQNPKLYSASKAEGRA